MNYEQIHQYIASLFATQDEAQERALYDSPRRGLPAISVKPEEGRFLQFLVHASGARRAVEIGTLGGYSGIWIARGLAPGGRLISLEKEAHHAQVAREHLEAAGVSHLVEVRVGDAHDLLEQLAGEAPFDFVFIDAEKTGYPDYLEWAVEHVRPGGVIAAHNALRGGKITNPDEPDEATQIMRQVNQRAAQDGRLISTIFPAGDGTLLAVKKAQL